MFVHKNFGRHILIKTINGFEAELFFLSNFSASPIQATIRGIHGEFPTAEHLFQAYKLEYSDVLDTNVEQFVHKFIQAPTPSKSKYLGRSVPLRKNEWDKVSTDFMKKTVEAKFVQNPKLLKKLLSTNNMELVEYNSWGDKIWGVDKKTGEGENRLGLILMNLRETLTQNNS